MPAQAVDLVARARDGDLDAFDALVRAHQDRIHNFLYRLTGNEPDAADLAQDTFLKAFSALPRFAGETARFGTWLYAIAANAARSRGRHLQVVRRVTPVSKDSGGAEGGPMEFAAEQNGPLETLVRREETVSAQTLLSELDADLREALVLREIEGLDYAAIAGIQGVPLGTVKTRIHRARLSLREKFEKQGNFKPPPASNRAKEQKHGV